MPTQNLNGSGSSWLAQRLEQPSLARYGQALRARWWLVALFVLAALLGAVVYVSVAPKTYKAEADLLVTPVSPDDPNLVGLPLIRDTTDPTADVLTVSKLVLSPQVAQRVAAQIGGRPQALLNDIQATPVTESEIIAVDATAASPARAARLANTFAAQTVNQRTASLHAQLDALIPALRSSIAGLSPDERSAVTSQLAVLQTLRFTSDPTVRVSSTASPPGSPASPQTKLSLLAGVLAGLILGLLAVFGLQTLDPRLRDEDQLRDVFHLPVMGRIPRQRSGRSPIAPRRVAPNVEEAFRNLRTVFTLAHRDERHDRGRSIVVTGDNSNNGKTTVALNLAAALVAAGKQVIVIEGDLRRPSIGDALHVRSRHAIDDVLSGEVSLVESVVWMRPYGPQLELLLADRATAETADRLATDSVRRVIREACEIADFVIVDSPPLPAVGEAMAFADAADDVLIVARVGQSRLRRLTDLGELLEQHEIIPTGVVLVGAENADEYTYYSRGSGAKAAGEAPLWGLLQRRGSAVEASSTNGSSLTAG